MSIAINKVHQTHSISVPRMVFKFACRMLRMKIARIAEFVEHTSANKKKAISFQAAQDLEIVLPSLWLLKRVSNQLKATQAFFSNIYHSQHQCLTSAVEWQIQRTSLLFEGGWCSWAEPFSLVFTLSHPHKIKQRASHNNSDIVPMHTPQNLHSPCVNECCKKPLFLFRHLLNSAKDAFAQGAS